VAAGRVRVGGREVSNPDTWIDPQHDTVSVDGQRVSDSTERIVIAFHKPVGLVTTRVDPGGRPTVSAWGTSAAGSSPSAASTAARPASSS
jgi:23S rRNA pseudouridine2605 synthase